MTKLDIIKQFGIEVKEEEKNGDDYMTKLDIIKQFGIEVKEEEKNVYKVLSTDKILNLDKIQWKLEDCILITSLRVKYEKLPDGTGTRLVYPYYIILGSENEELGYKYIKIARKSHKEAVCQYYKYNPNITETLDTIYRKDEY